MGEADGTAAGARIHCTNDGGLTWTRNFWAPYTSQVHFSLIEIRFSSDTDVWAVGGQITRIGASKIVECREALRRIGRVISP